MSRYPRLERLFEAQFELDTCSADQRGDLMRVWESLVRETCAVANCTRDELLNVVEPRYREYRRDRRARDRVRISQRIRG